MILNYNGYHVTKNELANNIKTVPLTYSNGLKGNPNEGFVGNMENGPGLAVYNGPIYDLAKKYAGSKVVNLTNDPFTDLLKRVSKENQFGLLQRQHLPLYRISKSGRLRRERSIFPTANIVLSLQVIMQITSILIILMVTKMKS